MLGKDGVVKWRLNTNTQRLSSPFLGAGGNILLISVFDIISVTGEEYDSENGDGRIPTSEVICCTVALIVFPVAFIVIRRKGIEK